MRRGIVPWVSTFVVLLLLGLGIGWSVVATGGQTIPPTMPTPHPNPTLFPTIILPPMTPVTGPPPTERPPSLEAEQTFAAIPTRRPEDPYNLAIHALVIPAPLEEQIKQSEIIAIGIVKEVGPARWTTLDGTRPYDPAIVQSEVTIFRPVRLEVERYLKGEQAQSELFIFALGGRVGQDSVTWAPDDTVEFIEGTRVLVFLPHVHKATHQLGYDQLWEIWYRYTITEDNQAINTYYHEPLEVFLNKIAEVSSE